MCQAYGFAVRQCILILPEPYQNPHPRLLPRSMFKFSENVRVNGSVKMSALEE